MMEEKQPFKGKCGKCEHIWTVCYLPMDVTTFAKVTKGARCPLCGHNKVLVGDMERAEQLTDEAVAEAYDALEKDTPEQKQAARESLLARFARDNCNAMDENGPEWEAWVNALPIEEFIAWIDMDSELKSKE